jgi:hypothetical protein
MRARSATMRASPMKHPGLNLAIPSAVRFGFRHQAIYLACAANLKEQCSGRFKATRRPTSWGDSVAASYSVPRNIPRAFLFTRSAFLPGANAMGSCPFSNEHARDAA